MHREAGTLFVVATPIGNLEDITARALRILRSVAVIAAEDTRRTAGLLAHFGIDTPTLSLHEHNEGARVPRLLTRLRKGDDVAMVSDAGMPTIADPGQTLVRTAIEEGVRVEVVPGPSAITAAVAGSGFEGNGFAFLGFAPTRSKDRKLWVERLKTTRGIAVIFEAPHRIQETLRALARELGDSTPVAVARELTKAHEEWVRGPIMDVLRRLEQPRGEYTVVLLIGQMTYVGPIKPMSPAEMLVEFGEITENQSVSRRQAINILARRSQMTPNQVYATLEAAKKSVK